jgi:hypothetical protein
LPHLLTKQSIKKVNKLQNQIVEYYNQYQVINRIAEEEILAAKKLKTEIKDLTEETFEKASNTMIDSLLITGESKYHLEILISFIKLYLEVEEEPLPQEIADFYKTNKQFAYKRLWAIEKDNLTPTDTELLKQAREQVKSRLPR